MPRHRNQVSAYHHLVTCQVPLHSRLLFPLPLPTPAHMLLHLALHLRACSFVGRWGRGSIPPVCTYQHPQPRHMMDSNNISPPITYIPILYRLSSVLPNKTTSTDTISRSCHEYKSYNTYLDTHTWSHVKHRVQFKLKNTNCFLLSPNYHAHLIHKAPK